MKQFSYGEPDYAFRQAMLILRTNIGLTQSGLAKQLGVSRRSVGEWEAGNSYPKAERLKQLIALGMQHRAFPVGREAQEIRALWQASHQKMLLDEQWLSTLMQQGRPPSPPATLLSREEVPISELVEAQQVASGPLIDWGQAQAIPSFYGREQEMDQLTEWVLQKRCQVVSVLGMGGIGKSALAVQLMYRLAEHFDAVLFRSLRDAPSCQELLDDCLQVLDPEPLPRASTSLEEHLSRLLKHLRTSHILLVLDNLEALLQEGEVRGHLRPGYEGYNRLLQGVAEQAHQSCLLLTSREKPAALRALEGHKEPVRSLRLCGLELDACEQLLASHELLGSPEERVSLIERYDGNPLALNIVAQTIADLFEGEMSPFLEAGTAIFGGIAQLLSEQWNRLSPLEQTVLCWLATLREPVTLQELLRVLVTRLSPTQLLDAIDGLRRRSLIERGQRAGSFTLQSVVLEYVTDRLVTTASQEIQHGQLQLLCEQSLSQAQAKEYVRQTQERLLLTPLLDLLKSVYPGRAKMEECLCELLSTLRAQTEVAQGYGPANLMALLRLLRGHLCGLDLSYLAIREAYLQGVELQDAKLCGAMLRDTVFTEALHATWAVAVSHTGRYWAAGSSRGEVRVWHEEGRTLHLIWRAHADTVYTLAFEPDERTLATGSWDGTVKLWALQDGNLLWTGQHTNAVRSVAFAPDGHLLASGGDDEVVRLWEVTTGRIVETLHHPGPVFSTVWSPEGQLLASGSSDGHVRVWQVQENQPATCIQTLTGHTGWVRGLAIAPNGRRLASGSWDRTVKLWNVHSGCLEQTLTGHTDPIRVVAWSPDGRMLASAGFDAMIRLWDVEPGSCRVLHGHTAVVYSMAFTPDSRCLLSGSEDGTLRVWDSESGECVRILQGHAISLYDVDWNPSGTQLATAGADMCITIWDRAGKTPPRVLHGHHWIVQGVAWSPDGRWLASGGWDKTIRLWNATTGACIQILRDLDHTDTMFLNVAWSPNGRLLASGSYLHGVQVWDATTHTRLWVGRTRPTMIRRVAWSLDSTRLASCGDDGIVSLWEASDGRQLQTLQEHSGMVASVAWSPDGTYLASGGSSGELFIWDVCRGERVQTLIGHSGIVFAIGWSKHGDLLVSGDSSGIIRWWDMRHGTCFMVQQGHQGTVQSLRFSPDGRMLASAGDDSAVKVWDVESAELLQTLRRDRPYERLDITGIRGLTEAQKVMLRMLGAIEKTP